MKKTALLIISILAGISVLPAQKVSVFPKKSFYLYTMASLLNTYPDHLSAEKRSGGTFIVGGGYRLINFHNRYFLNFEIDFTGPGFPEGTRGSQISITNFKLSLSHTPGWTKSIIFYTGIGISSLHYSNDNYRNHTETAMVIDGGMKIPMSNSFAFRLDIRGYFDPDNSGLFVYTDHDGVAIEHSSAGRLGLSLSAGMELRF